MKMNQSFCERCPGVLASIVDSANVPGCEHKCDMRQM